ncbi:MAG: hypothetical protein ACFFGZ_11215 [Candidatus Thorarchaeota archaeon]
MTVEKSPGRHQRRWTNDELNFLRERYGKISYRELADELGRTFESVKKKAQRLGLTPKCLAAEMRQNWRPNPTENQVLIGSLLGDGSVNKVGVFREEHSINQKDYLYWKGEKLVGLVPRFIFRELRANWTFKKRKLIAMYSRTFDCFGELRNEWYPEGKKIIPESIWQIEPLGLAIWFQDDGNKGKAGFRFATHAFSKKDHRLLQNVLQEKFNIKADIGLHRVQGKQFRYLRMKKNPARRFEEIIAAFVHSSMQYKLHCH